MNKNQIETLVKKYIDMGNKIFNLNLPYPTVDYFKRKTSKAGTTYYKRHMVVFNMQIASRHPIDFEETICHEVAHLFTHTIFSTAKRHHGVEFKSVMSRFGYEGSTYHSYDVTGLTTRKLVTKYIVKCSCKEHKITKRKFNNIGSYQCTSCLGKLTWTGKTEQYKGGARVR